MNALATTTRRYRQSVHRLLLQEVSTAANSPRRKGLTLIEILIALTMTMIVLFAMAQAFQYASQEIAKGRAVLEMTSRLRNVEQLLRQDLAGITVNVRPHLETVSRGYFEYIDRGMTDRTSHDADPIHGYFGDLDDILAFTSRRLDGSFQGRYQQPIVNGTVQEIIRSSYAEIIWYPEFLDINADEILDINQDNFIDFNESIALYRRVLLIRPQLNRALPGGETGLLRTNPEDVAAVEQFFRFNDISARWVDSNGDGLRDLIVANTLTDLAARQNRFARDSRPQFFPHPLLRTGLASTKMHLTPTEPSGDDILVTDLIAFDVQIYSPDAYVNRLDLDNSGNPEMYLGLSDVGFNPNAGVRVGGFVDLGKSPLPLPTFSFNEPMFQTPPSVTRLVFSPATLWQETTYCTWWPGYETDGIDQNGNGLIDEGTDGLDNDGIHGVDDFGEYETTPPYPYPARGIKVAIRIVEKNSKQVRQTSVIHKFLAQ